MILILVMVVGELRTHRDQQLLLVPSIRDERTASRRTNGRMRSWGFGTVRPRPASSPNLWAASAKFRSIAKFMVISGGNGLGTNAQYGAWVCPAFQLFPMGTGGTALSLALRSLSI